MMREHSAFTDLVKSGDMGRDVSEEVFDKISSSLRAQLKLKGIWNLPPAILGYEGKSWNEAQALKDLVFDCYVHIFIGVSNNNPGGKWDYWTRKVGDGEAIEKMVYRSIKNFVYDLQQKSSPEEAAIYKNLRKALKQLTEESGGLEVLSGKSSKFAANTLFGTVESDIIPIEIRVLYEFLESHGSWEMALGTVRRFSEKSTELVKHALGSTIETGHIPFQFGDIQQAVSEKSFLLLENTAHEVAPEFSDSDEKYPVLGRTWWDENSYEEKEQRFNDLEKLIHQEIDRLSRRNSIKQRMHEIVECYADKLRSTAFNDSVSQADISSELRISKQTLSDYMKTIREIIKDLQADGD